ncbi:hypothetical protein [Candidatus Nitrosocosmicus sp. SS]|jgi:hypothetical protein|uniref:hypothetical protein n=1 Tax=Candidatus Nitrosocosmicus agrestis TaxID=2563600 RepID=UPI00122E22BB|nr:hypothetical protein [Candidatus Nitrosocosmicus sp. SS]KAA2279070.1 hypothetical protein F1Z66_14430 [Candidatus Nitrosocosmicus sp. SS]KAF0867641.1 hypothetical protein E5N71_14185 [Candidatus Nitrosocosmicus sp. SS]
MDNLDKTNDERHNVIQNPYSKFIYAIRSPETQKRYPRRFKPFLAYANISGNQIEDQLLDLYTKAKSNPRWLQETIINFMILQKDRVSRGEIEASTISNYYKPLKLFCDMNDILLNWKLISRGIPRGRHASLDRAPTIQEIRKLLNYPDIRIRPIVSLMVTSGIRIGAWDYLKWKHIIPVEDESGNVIAAKVQVYAGEPEQYSAYTTRECFLILKEWMEYRSSFGEKVSGDSWLMRDLWKTTNLHFRSRLGSARHPKKLKNEAIRTILCRALLQQNIRVELQEGQRRHEFKAAHGFRKFFKTRCEKVMRPANIAILMGWDLGLSSSYYKPTEDELLQDYLKVVSLDLLTVDESYKLKNDLTKYEQKNQDDIFLIKGKLQEKDEAIRLLSDQFSSLKIVVDQLINGLSTSRDQDQVDSVIKSLYSTGLIQKNS